MKKLSNIYKFVQNAIFIMKMMILFQIDFKLYQLLAVVARARAVHVY